LHYLFVHLSEHFLPIPKLHTTENHIIMKLFIRIATAITLFTCLAHSSRLYAQDAMLIDTDGSVGFKGPLRVDNGHFVANHKHGVISWGDSSKGNLYFRTLANKGVIAPYNDLMTIEGNGNVGIGIGNRPLLNKLQVGGNLHLDGHSIYLRDNPKEYADLIRWIPAADKMGMGGWNGVILGYTHQLPQDSITPVLTIDGSGQVGIGTDAPRAPFELASMIDNKIGMIFGRLNEGNRPQDGAGTYLGVRGGSTAPGKLCYSLEHSFYGKVNSAVHFYRGLTEYGGYIIITTNNNSEKMRIEADGNVGIGTPSPRARLDVNGRAAQPKHSFGFLRDSDKPASGWHGGDVRYVSIIASGDIATDDHFIAYSDKRIKKDFTLSNPVNDLATLNRLKVTDYKYIDMLSHGGDLTKGFIAQEVEEVFPQAVTKGTDFVPDIFAKPGKIEAKDNSVIFTMSKPHQLANGNKIKLYTKTGEEQKQVTILNANSFSIEGAKENYKDVFIFGKEVSDFRMIDYDRLFTLNVSATQQLSREIEALRAENEELKRTNAAILKNMEARLQTLEGKGKPEEKVARK
jgi:hypothetical protein